MLISIDRFYDTKHMFENLSDFLNDPLLDEEKSNLENIYSILKTKSNKVKINIPENYPNYMNNSEKYHDAGFDACITGTF